jgi:hypothetical protein
MTTTAATELLRIDRDHLGMTKRLAKLQADIATLTAEAEALKDQLRELAVGTWVDAKGAPLVSIEAQRRFDPMLAVAYLTAEQQADCLAAPAWDPAAMKRHLTPAQLDACMVEHGKRKVGLK